MKRISVVLALVLVVGLATGSASAAKVDKANKANKAGKKDHAAVAGLVQKVDGANITVQPRGKNATPVTVTTDASTKFEGVASITDIKPGMRINATPETGTATKVIVHAGREGKGAKKKNDAAAA